MCAEQTYALKNEIHSLLRAHGREFGWQNLREQLACCKDSKEALADFDGLIASIKQKQAANKANQPPPAAARKSTTLAKQNIAGTVPPTRAPTTPVAGPSASIPTPLAPPTPAKSLASTSEKEAEPEQQTVSTGTCDQYRG